jgi:hypothetical protein
MSRNIPAQMNLQRAFLEWSYFVAGGTSSNRDTLSAANTTLPLSDPRIT